jgi:hypothetical protein
MPPKLNAVSGQGAAAATHNSRPAAGGPGGPGAPVPMKLEKPKAFLVSGTIKRKRSQAEDTGPVFGPDTWETDMEKKRKRTDKSKKRCKRKKTCTSL